MLESRDNTRALIAALILMVALGLFVTFDLLAAASLNTVITVSFAILAMVLGLLIFDSAPLSRKIILVGLLVTAVFALRFVNWDSRKPFLRDFNQVQQGMTTAEVEQIMTRYPKYISPVVTRTAQGEVQTGAISYRHTDQSWGDSDIGLVTFAGGRVVSRTFYPD